MIKMRINFITENGIHYTYHSEGGEIFDAYMPHNRTKIFAKLILASRKRIIGEVKRIRSKLTGRYLWNFSSAPEVTVDVFEKRADGRLGKFLRRYETKNV